MSFLIRAYSGADDEDRREKVTCSDLRSTQEDLSSEQSSVARRERLGMRLTTIIINCSHTGSETTALYDL